MKMRKMKTLREIESELCDKVWYNRHMIRREKIESGLMPVVEGHTELFGPQNSVQKDIWDGALAAAGKVEKKYGIENLGPYDDFEWGVINGKLSAIRWVLGDDWDNLDT